MGLADLALPEVDYDRTALRTVVCQLQFNPILRIGKEDPVEFQDSIRHSLPLFERREGQMVTFSFGPAPAVEHAPTGASYLFRSEDGAWTASLSTNALSLETSKYVNFADFLERFEALRGPAKAHYDIPSYTRLGLRYINVFTPDAFPGVWLQKFNPALLGPLSDAQIGTDVMLCQQLLRFELASGYLNLRHGLDRNKSYTIDLDHAYEDKIDGDEIPKRLGEFNRLIYQAFRWSISNQLHEEMVPHARV